MLDKSIEFKSVIMRIEHDKIKVLDDAKLPDGFSFRFFESSSDVKHWGNIEASVLEFDSESDACDFFEVSYLPNLHELQRRCIFITNSNGTPIATASAWYADSELGYQASLHWVAVRPEYQGKGLGRSITQKAINVFCSLEPGKPVWLHTQTWSHPAIKLYHSLGFNILKNELLANMNTRDGVPKIYNNDFAEAMQILGKVMDSNYVELLYNTAV